MTLLLTSMLLMVLFEGYQRFPASQKKTQEASFAVLSLQKVDSLLANLFSHLTSSFYTAPFEGESRTDALFFSFTGGIDPDPAFSGEVQGALYLGKKGSLYLTTWGKDDKIRTDRLLQNVKELSFSFFDPEKGDWVKSWPRDKGSPPPFCKLSFSPTKEQTLAFSLPTPLELVYKK